MAKLLRVPRATSLLSICFLLGLIGASGMLVRADTPVSDTGTWTATADLGQLPAGAAAATLTDGRLVIAGGTGDAGPRRLVSVFDSSTWQWAAAGSLQVARTDAAAASLPDGRVVVAGGTGVDGVTGSIEIFDPATGDSTATGALTVARFGAAAAALEDGRVLIAGGSDGSVSLSSVEVFDPATGASTPLDSQLATPRKFATATRLITGHVVVAGGNDGTDDLSSAELWHPEASVFTTMASSLTTARQGHAAVRLPNNGSVLIVGGSSAGQALNSSELLLPEQAEDPYDFVEGTFAATGGMTAARVGGVVAPTAADGIAIAGGAGLSAAEAYHFATIKTDKDDYAPYENALITGSGWTPNSTVTLVFQEVPAVHADYQLTVPTDANGNISFGDWAPEPHDLNVRFYLLASDGASKAQTTFTDSTNVNTSTSLNAITTPLSGGQSGVAYSGQVTSSGAAVPNGAAVELSYRLIGSQTNCGSGSYTLAASTTTTSNNGTFASTFTAPAAAGTYYFRASFADFNVGGGTGTTWKKSDSDCRSVVVSVSKTTPTVSVTNSPVTYNGLPQAALVSGSVAGTVSDVKYDGSSTVPTNVGTYAVTADFAPTDTGTYNSLNDASAGNFTINKADQTITFGSLATKQYGDADFSVSATGGASGQPVTFTASGDCTVDGDGDPVHITGAGSCTITAHQAGNANYNAAPDVPQVLTINKVDQAITFGALAAKQYGDADFSVSATGGASGNPVTFTASGDCTVDGDGDPVHITGAGSCTITAHQAGNANYNAAPDVPQVLTINKADQTISFGALATKQYGDADFSVSATGGASGNPVTFTASGDCTVDSDGDPVHITGAGSCTITAHQAGNTNYNAASDVPQAFTINKAPVTAKAGSGTATYNGSTHTPSACAVTGGYTGALTCNNDPSSVGPNADTYVIAPSVQANGENLNNFDVTLTNGSYTINKAPVTATGGSGSATYNGSTHTPSACALTGDYTGALACNNDPTSVGPNANTYPIAPSVQANGENLSNFDITLTSGSYTINKAPVTATGGSGSGTYNGSAQSPLPCAVTGTYKGALTCDNSPASVGPNANTYTIVPSVNANGENLNNFDVTLANGSYTINRADPSCSITGYTTTYNGQPHTATGSCVGVGTDGTLAGLSLSGTTHTDAADYPSDPWTFTAVNLNYNNAVGTVHDHIDKAAVTETAGSGSTVFDGAMHSPSACAVSGTYIGALTCSNSPASVGPAAATYTIVPVVDAHGENLSNYVITSVTGTYVIAHWTLTGFYQPVDMNIGNNIVWNTVKGGSTVPLKFNIFAGTVEQTATSAVSSFQVTSVPCSISTLTDDLEFTTTGGTVLRYDASGHQFIQNWQTPKKAGECYMVRMTALDLSTIDAYFKTK